MTAVPLLPRAELAPGTVRRVRAGGLDLVVVEVAGEVHVLANACPHAGATLHDGALADCLLGCRWHGSQFDVRTGAVARGPATHPLRRWAARVTGDWITIDV